MKNVKTEKMCSKCKEVMDFSYFGKDSSTKDGLRYKRVHKLPGCNYYELRCA